MKIVIKSMGPTGTLFDHEGDLNNGTDYHAEHAYIVHFRGHRWVVFAEDKTVSEYAPVKVFQGQTLRECKGYCERQGLTWEKEH